MKLSELVAFRSSLEQYDFYRASRLFVKNIQEAKADIEHVRDKPNNQQIRFSHGVYQDELPFDLNDVEDAITNLKDNFDYYKQQIDLQIQDLEEEYIKRSEKMYISDELPSARQSAKERLLVMDDDNVNTFLDRITQLSDWRYPGMIMNVQEGKIVSEMASSDPLYLLDMNESTLENVRSKMNDVYKHRVRPYVIDRFIPRKKYFGDLPNDQFSLIVIWNTLNNLPLSMCQQVLTQLFDLLRPGGTVLFTYNDCDDAHNIRNFENNFRQFTPGRRLVSMIENIGYALRYKTNTIHGWMELKKPGKLETIRGGQSLARVIHVEDAVITPKKTYTREQIQNLHQEAIALGIDTEKAIKDGAIEPGKLELLIERRKHAIKEERKLSEEALKEQKRLKREETIKQIVDWKATNQGYFKKQKVRFGERLWEALKDIKPKQRFDEAEWRLVE